MPNRLYCDIADGNREAPQFYLNLSLLSRLPGGVVGHGTLGLAKSLRIALAQLGAGRLDRLRQNGKVLVPAAVIGDADANAKRPADPA